MVDAELTPDTHHRSSKMLAGNRIIARVSHNATMHPLEETHIQWPTQLSKS